MKVNVNGPCHITKMATMAINSKAKTFKNVNRNVNMMKSTFFSGGMKQIQGQFFSHLKICLSLCQKTDFHMMFDDLV